MSDRHDADQRDTAEQLEQRYVAEHADTEEALEGLDPDLPEGRQTTEQVGGVASGERTAAEVEEMARDDR